MVLNAVGRAIVGAHTEKNKQDLDYALTKLNEAAALAPNNADIYLNLGNANRLKGKGGDAIMAYNKALQLNPTMGVAAYRAAMLYKTHITYKSADGWNTVLENLNAAVLAVGNEHDSIRGDGDPMRDMKLARAASRLAPGMKQPAVR